MKSKIVFTEENGTWSAHDPNVAGVYGLGPTREAAEADLAEAKALLGEYDASQADDEAEDAEDARLADEALDRFHETGITYTHDEVRKMLGLSDDKTEDVEDVRLADESRAEIRAGGVLLSQEDVEKRYESTSEVEPQAIEPQALGPQAPHVQGVDNETLQRRWKRFLRGDGVDPRPEVAQLLANIKAALPALEALNEDDDTEDGVYRFYYGSWKVYGLQERTEQIVAKMRALAPVQGKSLCTDFEEIVAAGTGKEWEQSHNAEWAKHTRPVVEAYFHARYFLVVAIEYGAKYERPPSLMDSGWAALLVLYGLR